jgi:UPF0755 protein
VPGQTVRVTIRPGATGREAGAVLARHGLIYHREFFRLALYLDKSQGTIKHGDYDLPRGLSPTQLLHMLYEGSNVKVTADQIPDDRKVTVPEGLSLQQAAQLFDDPDAFIAAASDTALIARLGVEADTLEGFLMPDTYFFDKPPTEREVVERMVEHFADTYNALKDEISEAADADVLTVVTVASLIEREARTDEERPVISAVIHNRLKRNIPLALDCTLQFALRKYGQRMLNEDKEVDSPYNTYLFAGLPPGPIASPGEACLRAALLPADVDYLYFVSNADGKTHTFSKTLREHEEARARYNQEMAKQRREQRRKAANGSETQ